MRSYMNSVFLEHLLAAMGWIANQLLTLWIDDKVEEFERDLPDQSWNSRRGLPARPACSLVP